MRARMHALAVLGAFLIGIGPGAPVQPCPRHWAAHDDEPAPQTPAPQTSAPHDTHAPLEQGEEQGGRTHADGGGETTHSHPHSSGPCDCLGTCLTCCGPALVAAALRADPPASTAHVTLGHRLHAVPAPDPAAYLRPFGQPPPA